MEIVCYRCENPILENDIRAELPCHHFFHTLCLVTHVRDQTPNGYFVCDCGAHIFHQADEDEEVAEADIHQQQEVNHEVTERQRIQTLYQTNAVFRNSLQQYKKKAYEMKRNYKALKKLSLAKKQEIHTQLSAIRMQLEGLTNLKKSEIQNSQIYKEYLKSKRAYNLLKIRIRNNYNSSTLDIWRSLQGKRGFQKYPGVARWRHRRYGVLTKVWSYHVP